MSEQLPKHLRQNINTLRDEILLAKAIERDKEHLAELDRLLQNLDSFEQLRNIDQAKEIITLSRERLEELKEEIEQSDRFFIEKIAITQLLVIASKRTNKAPQALTPPDIRSLDLSQESPKLQAIALELAEDGTESNIIARLKWKEIQSLANEFIAVHHALTPNSTPTQPEEKTMQVSIEHIKAYIEKNPLQMATLVLMGGLFTWGAYTLFKDKKKFEGALALSIGTILGMISFGQHGLKELNFQEWFSSLTGKEAMETELLKRFPGNGSHPIEITPKSLRDLGFEITPVTPEAPITLPENKEQLSPLRNGYERAMEELHHQGLLSEQGLKRIAEEKEIMSTTTIDILLEHGLVPAVYNGVMHFVPIALGHAAMGTVGAIATVSWNYGKDLINVGKESWNSKDKLGAAMREVAASAPKYGLLFMLSDFAKHAITKGPATSLSMWMSHAITGMSKGLLWPASVPVYTVNVLRKGVTPITELGQFLWKNGKATFQTGKNTVDWFKSKKAPTTTPSTTAKPKSKPAIKKYPKAVPSKTPKAPGKLPKQITELAEQLGKKFCRQKGAQKLLTKWMQHAAMKKLAKLPLKAGANAVPVIGTIGFLALTAWDVADIGMGAWNAYHTQERVNDEKYPIRSYSFDKATNEAVLKATQAGQDPDQTFAKLAEAKMYVHREGQPGKEIWTFQHGEVTDIQISN